MLVKIKYRHKKTNKESFATFVVPKGLYPMEIINKKYDLSGVEILERKYIPFEEAMLIDGGDFLILERQ